MSNIEIIEDKILTVVKHFGIDVFAEQYINGGKMKFPEEVHIYYDLDKMRHNNINNRIELGKGYFLTSIGFDCERYRELKKDNIEFTDEIIKSCVFITDVVFGKCHREYDQLHYIINGKPNENRLPDEVIDEIAEYMLSYDEMLECRKRFLHWLQDWFGQSDKLIHNVWYKTYGIIYTLSKSPWMNNINEVFISISGKDINGETSFEIWDYPNFDDDGQVSKDYRYFMPYIKK